MNLYTALILAGVIALGAAMVIHPVLIGWRVMRWRRTLKGAPVIPISPDGRSWSDGFTWHALTGAAPSDAYRSPDGAKWWDGKAWHEVVT